MPCNDGGADWGRTRTVVEYREPDPNIKRSLYLAELVIYASRMVEVDVPAYVIQIHAKNEPNPNANDKMAIILCEICGNMTKEQQNSYIYDGRDANARKLADWWDAHVIFDNERRDKARKELERYSLENIRGYSEHLRKSIDYHVNQYIELLVDGVRPPVQKLESDISKSIKHCHDTAFNPLMKK